MPVDHYKMTIQAKPLASLGEKHQHEADPVILGISRPLGHLRKTKACANSDLTVPRTEKSEDKFPHITSIGFYDSDDEMSSKESSISRETGRSRLTSRRGSLTSVGISKQQVFENRYKLAAGRSQPDASKPANMYSKRVVYLPMFRVNVETYIGEAEDHRTVETTRQSLRKMLDKSRSKMKSPEKIANKLRDYFKQQELDNIRKQDEENENKLSRKELLKLNLPKTPFLKDQDIIRIPSVPLDGVSNSKIEALDLTSVTEDDGVSLMSAKTSKTKFSGNDMPKVQSERAASPRQCFGPLYGVETDRGQHSNQLVTYADIRRMRQKGRLKVVSKTDASAKNTSLSLDQQDAKDWITIQSKPVLKYTTPQSTKQKLDPIIVPSHPCSECPMCKAAKYKSTEPTAVPPNSPTQKRIASDVATVSHEYHGDLHVSDHHSISVHCMNDLQIKGHANISTNHKNEKGKVPEVKPKRTVYHNDILPVSKVTVRIPRYREGLLKDAKLTNSNSSSSGSINEL